MVCISDPSPGTHAPAHTLFGTPSPPPTPPPSSRGAPITTLSQEAEREVYRAEAWRERLYAAVEAKADRGVFETLNAELSEHYPPSNTSASGSGKLTKGVFADAKDIETLQDCMRLFCLCQRSWQNDVFMVGCDACEDWYHAECVGLKV